MNRRRVVPTILLAGLSWNTAGCAQILGIDDLPPLQDAGSQPQRDAAARSDASSPVIPDGRPASDALDPPADASGLQRRKQITIDAAQVEAPATPGFLADFPVLLAVQDAEIAARASADASDIHFVDGDGVTRLAHEIEKWNAGTGELVAWVKLPRVSATEDTPFYVYYGDPAAALPPSPAQVWSNGFAAVWHLAESPGAVGGIRDSTTGNDGTAHASMQASDLVRAQIGDGIDFDGVDDEIAFQNPLTGPGPHTISVWVNQRSTTTQDALVVLGDGAPNRARWLSSVFSKNEVAFGFYGNDVITNTSIIDDGWTLLHWTYESRENVFYVDGSRLELTRLGAGVDTRGNDGRLGNAPSAAFGTNMHLNGQLDEVRIATAVRPAEWIRTEYNNQSSPSSFYSVGPETSP